MVATMGQPVGAAGREKRGARGPCHPLLMLRCSPHPAPIEAPTNTTMVLRAAGPQWRRCLQAAAAQQRHQFSSSALAGRVGRRLQLGATVLIKSHTRSHSTGKTCSISLKKVQQVEKVVLSPLQGHTTSPAAQPSAALGRCHRTAPPAGPMQTPLPAPHPAAAGFPAGTLPAASQCCP